MRESFLSSPVIRASLSVSVATGLYGISFGALGIAAGLTVWETQLLSLLMFTGGSQFAFVAAIPGGGATAVAAASLMGVRNAIYGAQMNALLRPSRWLRPAAAHVTIDESTAVALSQTEEPERHRGFWWTGIGVFLCWNLMTLTGSVASSQIDPGAWGLDGAAVAAFVGLLWPRLKQRQSWAIAIVAAVAATVVTPWLPLGIPILVAAVVAGLLGWKWA